MYVNGLRLPGAAVEALRSGRWRLPDDGGRLPAVFGDEASFPCFYGIADIARENETWPRVAVKGFLGRPDPDRPPGDIDPDRSVLLGDLAPDCPFALDYRTASAGGEPRVVYLRGDVEPRWVTVAPSFAALMASLHL